MPVSIGRRKDGGSEIRGSEWGRAMRTAITVHTSLRRRNPRLRLNLEALEGRVVLSASPPAWISIGPSPITDPFSQNVDTAYVNPPEITGAVQAVVTYQAPDGKQGAYVGGSLGGVWGTQDLFTSAPMWSTHTDNMPSLAINTLGLSPLDTTGQTVFAGTGPTSNGGVSWSGFGAYPDVSALETGLYLSTNGGGSWTALNDGGSPIYGTFISKVLPTAIGSSVAQETVLVGTEKGLFISTDGGNTFAPQTFTNPVLDVIADPLNTQRYYLLAGPDSNSTGAGVYLSDNAGQTWTSINGGALDSTVIGLIPTNGGDNGAGRLAATTDGGQTLLYMTFERNTNQNTYGVFRTPITAAGTADWKLYYKLPNPGENEDGGGSGNNLAFAIDPSDADIVYVGGYGINSTVRLAPNNSGTVEATQLTNEDEGPDPVNSLYDIRAFAFATKGSHEVLVLTSDSGVYGLDDPSTAKANPKWTPLMGNLSVAENYSVAAMAGPFGQLYVAGGAQDTASFQSTISSSGQTSWVAVNGGDGFGSAYDIPTGMLYATSDNLGDMQVVQGGTNIIEPTKFSGWNDADKGEDASNFPSLVAVSSTYAGGPFTPSPVAFSGYALYEAQPASLTSGHVDVVQINAPGSDTYSALVLGGTTPSGSADPYRLYAARGDGTLWTSDTFGAQVTQVAGWDKKSGTIVGLQLDPKNDEHIYALTKDTLYVTSDAGQTWMPYPNQRFSGPLGAYHSLGLVPSTVSGTPTNLLIIGALNGAEVIPDDPNFEPLTWTPIGANLPTAIVTGFAYVPSLDELVMSTFGRGDWLLNNASTQLLYSLSNQATTTVLPPSTNTWGQPALLTAMVAQVAPGRPVPTGSVDFYNGTASPLTLLGSAQLDAAGTAQLFLPKGLPVGALTLVANYSGDSNFIGSSGQISATVNPAPTVIGLTAPATAPGTIPLTLAAEVSPSSGGTHPAGVVTFTDNGTTLGTASLNAAGVAVLKVNPLLVGAHSLSASFAPAPGSPFAASTTSTATPLIVTAVTTSVSLIVPASASASVPVGLMAIAAASGGGGAPVGSVTFYDHGKSIGTSIVSPSGVATLTVSSFSVGSHTLTAAFHPAPGSAYLASPTSAARSLQVAPPIVITAATTTTLTATPLGPRVLTRRSQALFTVHVQAGSSGPVSGLVELLASGQIIAIGSLDSTGQVQFTQPVARLLNRPVAAIFLGGSLPKGAASPSQSAPFTPTARWFRTAPRPTSHVHTFVRRG